MSEDRNDAGQFTPSTDGLYGREHENAAAGFTTMPDRPKEEAAEFESAREAADALTAARDIAEPIEEVYYQTSESGEPIDQSETVSLERAAQDLTAYRAGKLQSAAKSISNDFAAEVDNLRADAIKENPEKIAEHYGIDPAVADKAQKPAKAEGTVEDPVEDITGQAIDAIDGLDPETRKALKIPQVRQALEQEFSKANEVHESYSAGLTNAHTFAQAAFFEAVPELGGLPADQVEQGLLLLQQVNPPRFDAAMSLLNRVHTIQTAQQQDKQNRAHSERQRFESQARSEDARFRAMINNAPTHDLGPQMVAYASELGIQRDQLVYLLQTNPLARSAEFQKIFYDAVQGRMQKNAATTATRAIPKDLPPVQRPGYSKPRSEGPSEKLQALEAKFHRSGSIRDAQALRVAQSRARGRA